MANYAVTTTVVPPGSLSAVSAALEAAVEAVADTKTIRLYNIFQVGGDVYTGVLVVAT